MSGRVSGCGSHGGAQLLPGVDELGDAFDLELVADLVLLNTERGQVDPTPEGVAAMMERRPPKFTGT